MPKYPPLDDVLVCDLFEVELEDHGKTSLSKIAALLDKKGYQSPLTGRAYTRQNIALVLKKSARGRKLVERNIKALWGHKAP